MHVIRALCGGLEWVADCLGQGANCRVIRVHTPSWLLSPGHVEAHGGLSGAPALTAGHYVRHVGDITRMERCILIKYS
jgi:hypothetical protein